MSDLYERIVAERGGFERLVARIPGFRGYLDLAARRSADRMLRDYVADLVDQRLGRIRALQKQVMGSENGLGVMAEMESARLQWQMFHDRIKAAAPGYSGFFALNKIDAEDLERLYSFDEAQAVYAERCDEALKVLEVAIVAEGDVPAALAALETLGREANDALRLRDDLFSGLGK
jgi:hypothetical protein